MQETAIVNNHRLKHIIFQMDDILMIHNDKDELEIFNEIDVVHSKLKKGIIYSKIPKEQQKKDIKKAELVIKLKRNIN